MTVSTEAEDLGQVPEPGSAGSADGLSSATPIQAPLGTKDVLWPESARWEALIALFRSIVTRAGFGLLVSPAFEDVRLFRRGIGDENEVVGKEMYEFADRSGRRLALRPEGTASVVRAYVQHRPPTPWKAWYATQAFRYERPQAGRYRQHHQLGVEAVGVADPEMDLEVIELAHQLYRSVGLSRVTLRLNTMGCSLCRPAFIEALLAYLSSRSGQLCGAHADTFAANPLRVLDCKKDECRAVTSEAPRLAGLLCDECSAHFASVRDGLDALGIEYLLDERLVRGFDYYTRTTFEFQAESLTSAQSAIGGGGRYDGLVEAIGGPPTPAVGFGVGIERLLLACDAEGCFEVPGPAPQVFVVDLTGGKLARDIARELRREGLRVSRSYENRSMRSQLRQADRSGATLAVIVGPEEAAGSSATLRELRQPSHQPSRQPSRQESVSRSELADRVLELLGNATTDVLDVTAGEGMP